MKTLQKRFQFCNIHSRMESISCAQQVVRNNDCWHFFKYEMNHLCQAIAKIRLLFKKCLQIELNFIRFNASDFLIFSKPEIEALNNNNNNKRDIG